MATRTVLYLGEWGKLRMAPSGRIDGSISRLTMHNPAAAIKGWTDIIESLKAGKVIGNHRTWRVEVIEQT